jgi:hypothetical protein
VAAPEEVTEDALEGTEDGYVDSMSSSSGPASLCARPLASTL